MSEPTGEEAGAGAGKKRHPKANATSFGPGNRANVEGRKGKSVIRQALEAENAELRAKLEEQTAKGELKRLRERNAELEREAAERAAVPVGRVRDPGSAKALEEIEAILRDCAAKREGRS